MRKIIIIAVLSITAFFSLTAGVLHTQAEDQMNLAVASAPPAKVSEIFPDDNLAKMIA